MSTPKNLYTHTSSTSNIFSPPSHLVAGWHCTENSSSSMRLRKHGNSDHAMATRRKLRVMAWWHWCQASFGAPAAPKPPGTGTSLCPFKSSLALWRSQITRSICLTIILKIVTAVLSVWAAMQNIHKNQASLFQCTFMDNLYPNHWCCLQSSR